MKIDNEVLSGFLDFRGTAEVYFTKYGVTNLESTASSFLMKDSSVNLNI